MTRRQTRHVHRRTVLRTATAAVGASGLGLSLGGTVTAGRPQRFIVTGSPDTASRLDAEGFDVGHALACGEVAIVEAVPDRRDDLEAVAGVGAVVRDVPVRAIDALDVADGTVESADGADGTAFEEPAFWDEQWDKRLLEVPAAHETATGDGVRVAVIDTGIEPGHPDLDPNLDTERSVRFANGEQRRAGDPHDADPQGHGTRVAGVVASAGFGTVGVAPDADLVSINIYQHDLEVGFYTVTDLLLALEYAHAIEADVVTMSLFSLVAPEASRGFESPEETVPRLRASLERLTNRLARAGTVMTAAAGNLRMDLQTGGEWVFPGGQHGVLTVSATGPNDELAYYSNYGSREIDVAAPGGGYETAEKTWCTAAEEILTCANGGDPVDPFFGDRFEDCACEPAALPAFFNQVLSTSKQTVNGRRVWQRVTGTSAATPQVAGVAALVREANPELNARQVEQVIERSAEYVPGGGDPELGAGRVNAARALEEATRRRS